VTPRLLGRVLALAFLLAACAPAAAPPPESAGGAAPNATPAPSEPEPGDAATAEVTAAPTPAPAIAEARAVELEWPVAVRLGNSDLIRLALVTREDGYLTPTAEVAGSQTSGTPVEIPNLYDTHTVTALARLDAAGFEIDRPGDWGQELLPGEPLRWQWTVRAEEAGRHVAVITLRLRFEPKAGGQGREREIYNRALTIDANTVLGLSGPAAQVLGGVGSAVGAVLGFPFLDKIVAALWGRLRPGPRLKP
jgi:hypothetical protein